MMKWLEMFMLRGGFRILRIISMTTIIITALIVGAMYSPIQEHQGSGVTLFPIIQIILSVIVLYGFRSGNREICRGEG